MVNLVATLNALYPDYDFSSSGSKRWIQHASYKGVIPNVNKNLAEFEPRLNGLIRQLWRDINDIVQVSDCQVYSYLPEDGDPFSSPGILWAFNYFFYNSNLNRILSLICVSRSKFYRGNASPSNYAGASDAEFPSPAQTPVGASFHIHTPNHGVVPARLTSKLRMDGDILDEEYTYSENGKINEDDEDPEDEEDVEAYDVTAHFDDD